MRVRGCEAEPGAHVVFATTGRRQVELTASDGHADTSRSLGVVVMRAEQAGVADAASKIGALAWSPAPESLAVATSSGQVLRLDPASAATLWDTGPRASRLQALAWTPSAEVLVAGGDDGSLLRISAADGAVVGEIGLGAPVSALATFAGGTLSCAAGTKLLLWR